MFLEQFVERHGLETDPESNVIVVHRTRSVLKERVDSNVVGNVLRKKASSQQVTGKHPSKISMDLSV